MTISQPKRGLFEVCKDLNPCPVSMGVDEVSLGACIVKTGGIVKMGWIVDHISTRVTLLKVRLG